MGCFGFSPTRSYKSSFYHYQQLKIDPTTGRARYDGYEGYSNKSEVTNKQRRFLLLPLAAVQ